jgi:hypothetical protein
MSLNVRSPYRRQKRDSIIRSSFRRPHTGIEVSTIIPTTLPSSRSHRLLPTFLRSTISYLFTTSSTTSYLLATSSTSSYLLATVSTISYLPTFLRSYQLLPYFLPSYLLATTSTISYLFTFLRSHRLPAINIHIVNLSKITHTRSANQNRAGFTMPRHGK